MTINNDNLQEHCIEFMENNNVPRIYISKWKNYNREINTDIDDYESMENLIIGQILDKQDGFFLKENNNIRKSIKIEIYKLLCTSSNEYNTERQSGVQIVEKIIPMLAVSLSANLGVDIALVSGIVSIIICGFFKIGKNAWCNCCKNEFED
ncbi:MAG: hypothetical protein N4A48_09425 [Tepidibacter sp.]|jgi:hypothetical protein|uniref:hypothetical protein n=1 Tax=Tepidibacter sp. TaxID=2529387 RepID=UPI0025DE6400|nr:hypothetical protein [Tepidibacter sp.]MCT4508966.1 hypothetical protein [Tepidibacter sp.]